MEAVYYALVYMGLMGGFGVIVFIVAGKLDRKYGPEIERRSQAVALEEDTQLVQSLIQTREFLSEIVQDKSQPEHLRNRAAALLQHYPGHKNQH